MAPRLLNKNKILKQEKEFQKYKKIKKNFQNIKILLEKILIMLVKILHMKRDLYITMIRKKKKEFMGQLQKRI